MLLLFLANEKKWTDDGDESWMECGTGLIIGKFRNIVEYDFKQM